MHTSDTTKAGERTHDEAVIVFPLMASAFGGAQMVRASARLAKITKADGTIVKVLRSALSPIDQWTAFNLADAAQ